MTAIDSLFGYIENFSEVNRSHLLTLADNAIKEARDSAYHRGYSYSQSIKDIEDEELLKEVD